MQQKTEEANGWYKLGVKQSCSGVTLDILAGLPGIGSPHAHIVIFNDQIVYDRQTSGLTVCLSGGSIILQDQRVDTLTVTPT